MSVRRACADQSGAINRRADVIVAPRRLTLDDIADAMAIQAACYPPLVHDGEVAFASRIKVAPDWCWAVESDGRLDAYLLSHPWPSMAPPEPDTVLAKAEGEVWYIHDLSVAPHARGRGLARPLLAACLDAHSAVARSELIAVEGAAPFWERLGWSPIDGAAQSLTDKVSGYGPTALYMARDFD